MASPRGFQCIAIASALEFYAKTKMKVNSAYTPTNMLATANKLTGKNFKKGQYIEAATELRKLAEIL